MAAIRKMSTESTRVRELHDESQAAKVNDRFEPMRTERDRGGLKGLEKVKVCGVETERDLHEPGRKYFRPPTELNSNVPVVLYYCAALSVAHAIFFLSEHVPEARSIVTSFYGEMLLTILAVAATQGCKLYNGNIIATLLLFAWHCVGSTSGTDAGGGPLYWLALLIPQGAATSIIGTAITIATMVLAEKPAKATASKVKRVVAAVGSNRVAASRHKEIAKLFNSTYVEIELIDDPGVIIRVLLDSGAATSVMSSKQLRHIWHKLKRTVGKQSNLISAGGGSLGVGLGTTDLRFKFPGYDTVYTQTVEIIDNDGVPSILGVDFLKAVSANMQYSDAYDTATWTTESGEKVVVPMHCSAPLLTDSCDLTIAQGVVIPQAGHSLDLDRKGVVAYVDVDPSQVRFNQIADVQPTIVTVESNNSITGDDKFDLQPTHALRPCFLTPKLSVVDGKLKVVVIVPIQNETNSELVLPPGTKIGKVSFLSQQDQEICSVSKEEYCNDPTVRECLKEYTDGHRQYTESTTDPDKDANTAESDTTDAATTERQGVKKFNPKTELPKTDWRRKLDYKVPALLKHVWEHESKPDYDKFLERYKGQLKFGKTLTEEQIENVKVLLFIFRKCASENPKMATPIDGLECRLQFRSKDPKPYTRGLPRLSPGDQAIQSEMTSAMFKNGVIEYADSEWSTGVVMAKKKGTTDKRYAVDYRGLNLELLGNSMGVPRIDDLLDHWAKASWFSTTDLASAFWSIPMRESDKKYTAFHAYCDGGFQQYQFRVMPFGIKPGSSIFQTAFQRVMQGLDFCKVYIDDGVVSTETESFDEHMQQLVLMFVRLEANNMTMKMSKSLWGTKRLPILGHIITAGLGCSADPEKVQAVLELAPPSTIQMLKSLLGAAGYLSKYIPEFAAIVKPLREMDDDRHKLTDISQEWDENRLRALDSLKAALSTAPVLAPPDFNKSWIILTDCSDDTMGACLAQLDDNGIERPVAYASATLSDAQQNYGITDKEGLAVVWAVKKWRHFIHGSSALVVTDHSCLRDLTTAKEFNNKRLMRYAVELSEHNLKVVFRPGRDHHLADLMSRMRRLTPGSVEARQVGDEAQGLTAELAQHTDCRLGSRALNRRDSDLFSPGSAVRRLRNALARTETAEGKTVAALIADLEADRRTPDNHMSGDEHQARIMEFYDMVASAGNGVSLAEITKAQQSDRFAVQMSAFLTKEVLPSDELEVLRTIANAPFYAVDDGTLVRVTKGKALKPPADGPDISSVDTVKNAPPVKRIYVPEGMRGQIVNCVHSELGHAGRDNTYQTIKSLFDWPTMHRDTVELVKHCANCQLHAHKAPAAPIMGHLRADYPGHKVAMDILHLSKDTDCAGYMLIVIDVFSRYAVGVILKDLKSLTVATALRDDILKHGWGRPDEWIFDGASYFGAEVTAGIDAWGALTRVSAPHHAESHGIIEAHNRSYLDILKCFGDDKNWRQYYASAFESYNRSISAAISSSTTKLAPIEVWRPGYTVTPYRIPTVRDPNPKHIEHFEQQLKLTEAINRTVKVNNERYLKEMEERPSNVRKAGLLRHFKVGDRVTRYLATGNRTIDKLSELQRGPYEVIVVEDTGVDYQLRKVGTTDKPIRCHVDHLREFKSFTPVVDDSTPPDAAAASGSKEYAAFRIMSERKHSARLGGGRSFLIQWKDDSDGTAHPCTWEVEENLTHCEQLMREWLKLSMAEKASRLKEAKTTVGIAAIGGGINAVTLAKHRLSDTEWLVLTDLSQTEYDYHTMLREICNSVGLKPEQVLLLWGSPPCETISPAGAVNQDRGSAYRIYSMPHWPARTDDSKYGIKARMHDAMSEKVIQAMTYSALHEGVQVAAENPRGGMERQLFMHEPHWRALTEKHVIDYCAFRHPLMKTENIWVSEFGWQPTGITGDGRCHGECESGSVHDATGRYRHDLVLSGPTGTGPSGKNVAQQKNAAPLELLTEILTAAVKNNTDPDRVWVVDLFAGYGSMRAAAKQKGLNYLAVDWRDFISGSKLHKAAATGKED